WMNGEDVAAALNTKHLPGLKFVSQLLIPVSGLYAGQRCGGVGIKVGEKSPVWSIRMGVGISSGLNNMFSARGEFGNTTTLLDNALTVQLLQDGVPPEKIVADWHDDLAKYESMRRKYLLYR